MDIDNYVVCTLYYVTTFHVAYVRKYKVPTFRVHCMKDISLLEVAIMEADGRRMIDEVV